jgi:hypothetical protein
LRCVKRRIACNFKEKESRAAVEDEVTVRDRIADTSSVTGERGFGEFA